MRLNSQTIRIAARHSDLARLQAYRVGDALKAKFPELEVKYAFRASLGDINLNDPLWKMPEKGVFTEDFVRDLKEGDADLVVHSWKDLPTHLRPDTEIVATLPRADVRDLMLFRKDRAVNVQEKGELRVLTSSPRRAYNLESFLKTHLPYGVKSVAFETVRGNIPTRLKKLLAQDVDALIVAKAALDRLLEAPEPEFAEVQSVIRETLAKTRYMVLPLSVNPTAAAQGALAIEISRERGDLRELLSQINCAQTFETVQEERRTLASYGGGCHQKIGINVLARPYGNLRYLRGLTDAGQKLNTATIESREIKADAPKTEAAIFPRAGEEAAFFDREYLDSSKWSSAKKEKFIWVARESAWPKDFKTLDDAIVWTAGLGTWKSLAARGIWVSGSAESLGENESPRIDAISGISNRSVEWLKLTHETAGQINSNGARSLATYRLVPRLTHPDLRGRTHFYWMSGSSFDRALELYPEIRNGFHASGPGATHAHIVKRLGSDARVAVFINVDDFRATLLGATTSQDLASALR